jgi:histone demethylase JARID1
MSELNKLHEALEGDSLALQLWENENFGMVSADANEICIDKQEMERNKGLEDTDCEGTKDSSNINAPSNVTSELMQSESHLVTLSAPNGSTDSDSDNKMVVDKDKVDQAGSLDLNLDVISAENEKCLPHIADNHNNKGDSVEEKLCCSETKKEHDNMELDGVGDLLHSSSVVKTEVSSCLRDVNNSCTSDGGKYEADLQMDSDSRKKPKIAFEKEVINPTSASISLTQESILMQIFGTSVKPISLGSVVHGKLWCSKHAIFPKGML